MMFEFFIQTKKRQECVSLVDKINGLLKESGVDQGLCNIFVHHTTAALTILESADPNIHGDLFIAWNKAVPQHAGYAHDKKDNNAQSHILGAMVGPSETLPLRDGKLDLGTWQDLVLVELDGPRERKVSITILRDEE
jgi:secondary thiamine-phosphate synthase enzyme